MTEALQRGWAGDSSDDLAHLQLVLARLWAAEKALATEIAEGLEISENAAQVLARMRIDEMIDGRCGEGESDFVAGYRNESYCRQCWALVTPDPVPMADYELFDACTFCGQAAYSGDDWRDAA